MEAVGLAGVSHSTGPTHPPRGLPRRPVPRAQRRPRPGPQRQNWAWNGSRDPCPHPLCSCILPKEWRGCSGLRLDPEAQWEPLGGNRQEGRRVFREAQGDWTCALRTHKPGTPEGLCFSGSGAGRHQAPAGLQQGPLRGDHTVSQRSVLLGVSALTAERPPTLGVTRGGSSNVCTLSADCTAL